MNTELENIKGDAREMLASAVLRGNGAAVDAEEIVDRAFKLGQENALARVLPLIEEHEKSVRLSDKTPKYEYSTNKCDANNAGKFCEGAGERWMMPRELAEQLTRRVKNLLSTPSPQE